MWQGKILEFRKFSLKGFARKKIVFEKKNRRVSSRADRIQNVFEKKYKKGQLLS
jgi:hypothetical protein